jgi:hypothetical protein
MTMNHAQLGPHLTDPVQLSSHAAGDDVDDDNDNDNGDNDDYDYDNGDDDDDSNANDDADDDNDDARTRVYARGPFSWRHRPFRSRACVRGAFMSAIAPFVVVCTYVRGAFMSAIAPFVVVRT